MDLPGNKVGGAEMKLLWKDVNITGYCVSVNWSGSAVQAARSVTFLVAYSPEDEEVKNPKIRLGDKITFYPGWPENKKVKFSGKVTTRERKNEAGTLSYTAMDGMIHLLRSNGTYKFRRKTPETITLMVAKDVNVPIGNLAQTKINIKKVFFQQRPYYEIIMAAYTKAHKKNKKKYIAQMNGTKLEVVEKGKIIPNFHLVQGELITDSSYSETIDSMVNRVYIYNDSNKKIGSVSNADWVDKYGVFQGTISVDSGSGKTEAKSELHGIDKTASLNAIGDIRCVSGMGVKIKDSRTGLNGRFWIENDSHTWENGNYTMSLELAFKNVMDEQEGDEVSGSSSASKSENSALNDVLDEARNWLGTGENPPGSNHNAITEYYGFDAAWCCMFIWTIFNRSGHGNIFMNGGKTAYCFDVMNWYKKRGKFGNTPKVGALIIYGGSGHIGIVENVSGSSFVSIEGNLSDCVKRSNGPSCSTVLGYCYPDYPATKTSSKSSAAISGKAISIPESVAQTGIIADYTNYNYFYTRWTSGTNQRQVADLWAEGGKKSKNGIAALDGYYLVAVRPVFGNCGDVIAVVLEGGERLNCIIADVKGTDATSEWGHVFNGKISIIEFESIGNSGSNTGARLNIINAWKGKRVTTIINGGKYAKL